MQRETRGSPKTSTTTTTPSPPYIAEVLPIDVLVVYGCPIGFLVETAVMGKTKQATDREMLQGTLDMLILKTLVMGPAHGHTIAHVIEHASEDVLQVEQGSLYPALHRLEDRGWLSSHWGPSENNRKAKFYKLTATGRKQLALETNRWREMARAIGLIMGEEQV
jgi:PadR family transcriptional regulator PadR